MDNTFVSILDIMVSAVALVSIFIIIGPPSMLTHLVAAICLAIRQRLTASMIIVTSSVLFMLNFLRLFRRSKDFYDKQMHSLNRRQRCE